MSAILLDQDIIHYETLGRGRPLIFLHGWVGSWRYWIPMMQAASLNFRAYALDLFGFGDSAKNNCYAVEQQSEMINGFLDKMGIGRVALVGHGLGAAVALDFARKHPGVVDRVMAVSFPLEQTMINSRLRSTAPVDLAGWLLGRSSITEAVYVDAAKTDLQAVISSFNSLQSFSLQTIWQETNTASLLVHGWNDPAVQHPRQEQVANLPEQVSLVTFDQGGHFPMLDDSSKFNRLMNDFLTLASGESPRQLQLKEEWKRRVR